MQRQKDSLELGGEKGSGSVLLVVARQFPPDSLGATTGTNGSVGTMGVVDGSVDGEWKS